ncbi:unnamed protein product, partial [marine sediment metagenome]
INNQVIGSKAIGIAVGFGTDNAADIGTVVDGNIVSYSGAEGIKVSSDPGHNGNDATEVKGNKIYVCSTLSSGTYPAIRVSEQNSAIYVQDNTIFAPDATAGIWVQANSEKTKLYDNNIIDGGLYGIRIDDSIDAVVRDNKVDAYDTNAFLEVGSTTGTKRTRNTFDQSSVTESGSTTISLSAATSGTAVIAFDNTFDSAPVMQVTPLWATGGYAAGYFSLSTTGVTLIITEFSGTPQTEVITVNWTATGI